jgi:hypothetical protein
MDATPLVSARLALAWSANATAGQRAAAVETAKRVRGPIHPDVVMALMLEARAGKTESLEAAREMIKSLQVTQLPLFPE